MFFDWLFGKKNQPLGKVVHYFDKIQVAVVQLDGALKSGDRIRVTRGDQEFFETVGSMQVDHQEIQSARRGDEVAIRVNQPTKDGALIYRA